MMVGEYCEKFFGIKEKGSNIKTELMAGTTTFLTAAYIIFVHPEMLAQTGMDKGALISVTCLVSALSTLLMALFPRVPIMMAPGMGLNAFFTFTLCLGHKIPWPTALGIVFLSGFFFLLMTLIGIREKFIQSIPETMKLSISIGIGFFIAFIGMKNMGLIADHPATLVSLGKFTPEVFLGICGLFLTSFFMVKNIKGGILYGILLTTVLGMIFGLVNFPERIFSLPPSIGPIAFKLDIGEAFKIGFMGIIFSFMYVDLFDSLGTLVAVSNRAGMMKEGKIEKIGSMLICDAVATVFGSLLGTSTTVAYIESASGVSEGGRTGLTSLVTAGWFFLALFFASFVLIVPSFATAPALIVVGIFMIQDIKNIPLDKFENAVPAFLTILLMPLTYSIADGIMIGFLSFVILRTISGKFQELNPVLVFIAILSLGNLIAN